MNHIPILLYFLFISYSLTGQSLVEKIALDACQSLDSIESYKTLQDSIQGKVASAMANTLMGRTSEEKKRLATVEGIRGTIKEVYEILPSYCYNIRRLMLKEKKKNFYKISDNSSANEHFQKGNILMESGSYKNSIKEFKRAIKLDQNFVYAIDHLAIAYRRLEDFKTAIKYYKQSLDLFPEGEVALLNIAVSYLALEKDDDSLKYYELLKFYYRDDPEGYFGTAKILLIKEDYENALDNLFVAHRIYTETNSKYLEDSEKLMNMMFSKLKEINKEELIEKKAKEHNISIKK